MDYHQPDPVMALKSHGLDLDCHKEFRATLAVKPVPRAAPIVPQRGRPYYSSRQQVSSQTLSWLIADEVNQQGFEPWDADVPLYLFAFWGIPHGSKKKWGTLCMKRPDLDNLMKMLGDAMTGFLFPDDGQIVMASISKQYTAPPGYIEIILKDIPNCGPTSNVSMKPSQRLM